MTFVSVYSQNAKPYEQSQHSGRIQHHVTAATHLGNAALSGTLLDQIEALQLAKALEQLHDLLVIEVGRETANEELVWRVGDRGADHARKHAERRVDADVVLGPANAERCAFPQGAVQLHCGGGFVGGTELDVRVSDLSMEREA